MGKKSDSLAKGRIFLAKELYSKYMSLRAHELFEAESK